MTSLTTLVDEYGYPLLFAFGFIDTACGLSTNPMGWVRGVEDRLSSVGPLYVLSAKFVPGAANLIAPVSGLSKIRARHFFVLNTASLTAWSVVYLVPGAVFDKRVLEGLAWLDTNLGWVLPVAAALVVLAGIWRLIKIRIHRRMHRGRSPEPVALP